VPSDRILLLTILLIFSFGANVLLGYFREMSRKFTLRWFFLIHVSIPFIIILRIWFEFSWRWIPLTLAAAVAGQIVGGKTRRKKLL